MLNSESKDFVRLNHLPLNTVLTDHISVTFSLLLGYRLVRLPFMLSAPICCWDDVCILSVGIVFFRKKVKVIGKMVIKGVDK